jgi:mRNA interferase HigB
VHVISYKRIREAKDKYPQASSAMDGWYRIMKKNTFNNFSEVKRTFGSVDISRAFYIFYIFDVGGNKLRIITNIHFDRRKFYIRHVLTHKEYDKQNWKIGGYYEKR